MALPKPINPPRPEGIAAFDYSYMIFVVFWGYVVFDEAPDLPTLAGIALISTGGLMMLRIPGPGNGHGIEKLPQA